MCVQIDKADGGSELLCASAAAGGPGESFPSGSQVPEAAPGARRGPPGAEGKLHVQPFGPIFTTKAKRFVWVKRLS